MLDESDREGWAEVLGDEPLDNEPDTLSEMDDGVFRDRGGVTTSPTKGTRRTPTTRLMRTSRKTATEENPSKNDDARAEDHERETEAPEAAHRGVPGHPSRLLREERAQRRAMENELANARARIAAYEVQQSQGPAGSQDRSKPLDQKPTLHQTIILDRRSGLRTSVQRSCTRNSRPITSARPPRRGSRGARQGLSRNGI